MKYIKRLYNIFLYTTFVTMFLFLTIYTILIFKPLLLVKITNTLGLLEYNLQSESIDSNNKLLFPVYSFNNLEIKNTKSNQVIKISNLKIGINIIRTIKEDFLSLNLLEIKDISIQGSRQYKESNSGSAKMEVNFITIDNTDLQFESSGAFLDSKYGKTSIHSGNGKLNGMFFEEINFFISSSSTKLFYSGLFSFDEKEIADQELINLNSFLEYSIDLKVWSKGYFDFNNAIIKNLNKYEFKESMIKTSSNFKIDLANIKLYENIDKFLNGVFQANIPNQKVSGSIDISDGILIKTKLKISLDEILSDQRYFSLSGDEFFDASLQIKNNKTDLHLESNLKNTKIISIIDEISKNYSDPLKTYIQISDLSNPSYLITNRLFEASFDQENNGYFAYGFQKVRNKPYKNLKGDGLYVYLNLDNIDIEDFLIDSSQNDSSNLKLIDIQTKKFNLFNNIYDNQNIKIKLNERETVANFSGKNLNGKIRIDTTGFTRIDVFDTKFEFDGVNLIDSTSSFSNENINVRFVGKNIQTYDDTFQDVDFYFLRNKNITTIDNIRIQSKNFNIGPFKDKTKAYISYNKVNDLYKVRGSYSIDTEDFPFKNSLSYKFDYLYTDLNIQWNSLNDLRNLEGDIVFLIKNLESKSILPDSVFLRALKIFNLNAMIEAINNESIGASNLTINRAQGDLYVSQKRAFINTPIKLETNEAKMEWIGEVVKDSNGILNELNLDLDMRLKVSENIPWYAAIFGGIPALAGGFIFENIIDESLDDVSTFKFKVSGNIDNPEIKRLN